LGYPCKRRLFYDPFNGRLYVGVTATVCEHEGELELMEMGSGRVDTLDKALTMIRDAVASRHH
jgi:hypothetical protein